MGKREITVNWGGHSAVKVVFETNGPESKVKLEPENKDGTILTINSDDQVDFAKELQQLIGRFYI